MLDSGVEADAIVSRRFEGGWVAVEVKLSPAPDSIDAAAASLRRAVHRGQLGVGLDGD